MNIDNKILKYDQYVYTKIFYNNMNFKNTDFFDKFNFIRIGSISDNSCFYHCICFILNLYNYRNEDINNKKYITKKIRYFLYKNIVDNKEIFDKLSNGNMKNFIKYDVFCHKLLDCNEWFDEYLYEYISDYFNVNIFIIHNNNINKFYTFSKDNNNLYYNKNRNSNIILYNIDNLHYEIVALKKDNIIKFIFNNDFINFLNCDNHHIYK